MKLDNWAFWVAYIASLKLGAYLLSALLNPLLAVPLPGWCVLLTLHLPQRWLLLVAEQLRSCAACAKVLSTAAFPARICQRWSWAVAKFRPAIAVLAVWGLQLSVVCLSSCSRSCSKSASNSDVDYSVRILLNGFLKKIGWNQIWPLQASTAQMRYF